MKFLTDRCAGRFFAEWLREEGHDVVESRERGPDPGDRKLLQWSEAEGRILVTTDKDFGEWPRRVRCVRQGEPDLIRGVTYRVLPDPRASRSGYIRVVDESGEDYLYPRSYFHVPTSALKGVQFLVDENGEMTGVFIDFKRNPRLWEDVYDVLLARKRADGPRESLANVKRRLRRAGKLPRGS